MSKTSGQTFGNRLNAFVRARAANWGGNYRSRGSEMILLFLAVLLFARNGFLKVVLVIGLGTWICHRHPEAAGEAGDYLQSLEQRLDELIDQYEQSQGNPATHFRITPEKTPAKQI
jgi:hypothetical protein